ncbi:MAG: translation initiation factor IF-6 [Thermoplasmata archaeon]|nr:translation initiation factor IF-6 [Thermoplasmata archaeon]
MMRLSRYSGSPNIAVFSTACESLALTAADASPEFVRTLEEALGVDVIKMTVAGSFVVGSLVAMNSNGAVVSDLADDDELAKIRERLPVVRIEDRLNAAGNNILVNDHGAIVSPEYSEAAARMIGEALGVEAVRSSIGGINTVGSVCRVTNKGCVCHMEASDEEIALIKDVLKVEAVRTTVNHGVRAVGAGIVANSNGAVVGDETTPIEMGRIEEGLVLY